MAHLPRGKERGAPGLQQLWGRGQGRDRGQRPRQRGARLPDTRTPGPTAGPPAPHTHTHTELPGTGQVTGSAAEAGKRALWGFPALISLLEGPGGSPGKRRVTCPTAGAGASSCHARTRVGTEEPKELLAQGCAHRLRLTRRARGGPDQPLSCPAPGPSPAREGFT